MNKLLNTMGAASLLLASGSASAITVGGVDWGTDGETKHIDTTTLAETFINASGQTLTGYGQVNTVNGDSSYAGSDKLYFVFNYIVDSFSATDVTFSSGVTDFYLGSVGNLTAQSSADNLTAIQALGTWATFSGHDDAAGNVLSASGSLLGSSLSFNGGGLIDIDSSSVSGVYDFLNGDSIGDGHGGFADIAMTTSSSNNAFGLNSHDDVTGCDDGSANVGQWCLSGSADFRGGTEVPEPATIALLGLGLVGLGGSIRKQKAKVA